MSRTGSLLRAIAFAALVLAAAIFVRERWDSRVEIPGEQRWVAMDSDTLYHVRRLSRLMEEGFPVAERDPYLDYPQGSAIPWPPYYTIALWAVLAPLAPQEPEARRAWLEEGVASMPLVFGVATSILALAGAWMLAGPTAGLFAGLYHALTLGSITYSRAGNGDHHAWISFLNSAMFLVAAVGFRRGALERTRSAVAFGAAGGVLAGVLLGSWVASLLYVALFQLALGLVLVWNASRPRPGIAAFGLAYHVAALAVILPAVLASPWKEAHPWMVVNLSWFHLVHLVLGALVFVPLLFVRGGTRVFRLYPWLVAASLVALALVFALLDVGPAAGIREGFAWVSAEDRFMAQVGESYPLVGAGVAFPDVLFHHLGFGAALLPIAWLAAAIVAWRARDEALALWVVAVAGLLVQALLQRRFADALAMPMASLLGWGAARFAASLAARITSARLRERVVELVAPLALGLLAISMHWTGVVGQTLATAEVAAGEAHEEQGALAAREMAEWVRSHSPETRDYCVLANWGSGHLIEWGADRPSSATNFGSYVGLDGFQAPSRFFLEEDHARAEEILESRRAQYVFVLSSMPGMVAEMVATACPDRASRYLEGGAKGRELREAFFDTLGAHLLLGGVRLHQGGPPGPSVDFLRLVYASPIENTAAPLALGGMKRPFGFLWQHVAGARVEAHGSPGDELRVALRVSFREAGYQLVFQRRALAGDDGIARIRVPYATLSANGEGIVGESRWNFGPASGALAIAETDVSEGRVVRVPRED
jgi:asparagine N-glycosylation enzyme membrane subunit Stt3